MFSNSSGFQFIGNVCTAEHGDIILQNSDLVVRGPDRTLDQPALAASTLESVPGAGTHGYLGPARGNHDAASQFPMFAALEFDSDQPSERERAGVIRNSRRAMAVRAAPYASSSHPSRHLFYDEAGPIQAPQSSYPSFEGSFSSHYNFDYDIDIQSEYPLNDEEIQSYGSTGPIPVSSSSSSSDDPLIQPYADRRDRPFSEYPFVHPNTDDGMGSQQNYAHIGSGGTHEECLLPPQHASSSSLNASHGFTAPVQTSQSSYPSFETTVPSPHTNPDYPLQPYPDRNHHPQTEYPSIDLNTDDATGSQQNYAPIGSGGTHEQHPLSISRPVQPHPQSFHGNIFSAHQIVNGQHINNHGESGINILHRAVALEALFDSADSSADGFPQPKCHPETRKEVVDKLYNWAVEDDPSRPIHWLHGPAGAGKSAIMRTLCELLQNSGRLGGAFFFKQEHMTRGNAKVLFATLAYQAALNSRSLKTLISQSVEADPSVVGRQMDVQLNKLIVEPCQALPDSAPTILLIDGLDECDTHGAQSAILCSICTAVLQHPTKFRFLIASRPEAHIHDVFEETSFDGILDSTDVEESFEDVRTYFRDEFSRIHREHRTTMSCIPAPWPSKEIIDSLVWNSSGYFIYASTVVKFIDDKYYRPTERLEAVLHNLSGLESDTPFASLDQLYIQILCGVPPRFHSRLRDIFVLLPSGVQPRYVDLIFEMQPGDTELILRSLNSVLYIDVEDAIAAHHASFLDFLEHPLRSSTFHPELKNRENVVRAILKVVSDDSKWGELDTWYIEGQELLQYIYALPPSEDLVPLIRQASRKPPWCPCPFWVSLQPGESSKHIQSFVSWLKAIEPVPEDLIRRWEAYESFFLLDGMRIHIDRDSFNFKEIAPMSPERLHTLQANMSDSSSVSLAACYLFVAQCPTLICMLQALWLLSPYGKAQSEQLMFIQLLLDLPWDDLTTDLPALRSLIDGEHQKQHSDFAAAAVMIIPTVLALSVEVYPNSIPDLTLRVARGVFRLIRQVRTGCVSFSIWCDLELIHGYLNQWGQLIRQLAHSQSSPDLLRDLREFVPHWDMFRSHYCDDDRLCVAEFYHVVQWLKAFPNPSTDVLEVLEQWQGYLQKSREFCNTCGNKTDEYFERRWAMGMGAASLHSRYNHPDSEFLVLHTRSRDP
ncbi:hypothetical protein DFH06DRAFT_284075 [Mycena polygramma]|nr:hypothetical protein DFH06DRAFT_284075 [Mycena polygramma]